MELEPLPPVRSEGGAAALSSAVVLTTRIRLARNLAGHPFPGRARKEDRDRVIATCLPALQAVAPLKRSVAARMEEMPELHRQVLFERHLISRELMQTKAAAAVVVGRDQQAAVMVNEEDHLRLQVLRPGFQLRRIWTAINAIDTALETQLDYAFDPELGYLTACPSNVGTGMRASAMMHLPGLVLAGHMDRVIHAVNQLGIVVRGLFGEGSDASGSIFQISNQTTLGESEEEILQRVDAVLHNLVEQERQAREKELEHRPGPLADKIGRAHGILRHARVLTSSEATNWLSYLRLGADLAFLPEDLRAVVDRLLIECQPGHVRLACPRAADAAGRDLERARLVRTALEPFAPPDFRSISL